METPNFDRINPIECVNGKVKRLHRTVDALYQSVLKPFGLKGSMLSMLFVIGKRNGINQKQVAVQLVLDQSTVSRNLKKFEQKGWLEVKKGDDPRSSTLHLTEEGYALLEEVVPLWEEVHNKVTKQLGEFNIQQLDLTLAALKGGLTIKFK